MDRIILTLAQRTCEGSFVEDEEEVEFEFAVVVVAARREGKTEGAATRPFKSFFSVVPLHHWNMDSKNSNSDDVMIGVRCWRRYVGEAEKRVDL